MFPAIFLDRDGVIIENRAEYVRSWSDVEIFPQAVEALRRIRNGPYKIVIVTNQSAVGRGLMSEKTACNVNEQLVDEIVKAGGRVDGVFTCPHAPGEQCDCRKPMPGLILRAALALSLDLPRSIMIGDAISDLLAGHRAGVGTLAMVQTGRGAAQSLVQEAEVLGRFRLYKDLTHALHELIALPE